MAKVPLAIDSHIRTNADEIRVRNENRFFEKNVANTRENVALIIRPALRRRLEEGPGPGRRVYTQSGFCENRLFHVTGPQLWRVERAAVQDAPDIKLQITGFIDGTGAPDMVATQEFLFIADGHTLQWTNGTAALAPITVPDDIPMISLDVINGYTMCVQNNSQTVYWIEPGAVTIDPLNFFQAERLPDHILQVRTVGDQFWLLGEKSTEVWRMTTDPLAPFQRIEGRLFDRGIFGGTAVKIKDSVIVVGNDGMVYDVQGGPTPISTPGIAERIRRAIKRQGLK